MNVKRTGAVFATLLEQITIKELIEKHTKPTGEKDEDGRAILEFNVGWNTHNIAGAVSPRLNGTHVSNVAKGMGWKFKASPATATGLAAVTALIARIDDIDKTVLMLLDRDDKFEARLAKLEEQAAPARGPNVDFTSWILNADLDAASATTGRLHHWFVTMQRPKYAITSNADLKRHINNTETNRQKIKDVLAWAELSWAEYAKFRIA